jgi:hypothetical protein
MSAGAGKAQDRSLSVTVYNQDLGAVRDERVLTVQGGRDTLRFTDVPARIDPTSVHLEAADGKDLEVLEQNYAYDLVGASTVLNRYLDLEVRIRDEDGEVFEGTLLSHTGEQILMAPRDGSVIILRKERMAEIRCPALPEGLTTRPTLIWQLQTRNGGERRARVSYLTGGLSWAARYVAVVNEEETEVRLGAWVSLTNESGTTFPDADLQLVAGDVHRVREPRRFMALDKGRPMEMAGAPAFEEEAFFEYHLYTLDRTTTLADKETKQIALFQPTGVDVEKQYEFAAWKGEKVRVVLVFENSKDKGLGLPLPGGIVRVYKADRRERLQFIGEDRISHTPRDEEVRLFLGDAFDIVGERKVLDRRRISDRVREEDIEISLRNRKESGEVEIIVEELLYGDWTILQSSLPYEQKEAQKAEFRVKVPAGEETILTYTVRYR